MVSSEELQAFDLLLWLGSGREVSLRCGRSQPTISRYAHRVAERLDLRMLKKDGQWQIRGEAPLLSIERQVHQLNRLLGREPMRIEAAAVSGPLLLDPCPSGWICGRRNQINLPHSLGLLRDRVIDAWITTSSIDLPPHRIESLHVIDLYRNPIWLVAHPQHPLQQERGLGPEDLRRFPSVGVRGDWYPVSQEHLRSRGLWSQPLRVQRYTHRQWEGRCADGLTLAYASPTMLGLNPALKRLDHDLDFHNGAALLVHQDHADSAPVAGLVAELQRRCREMGNRHPELQPI